MVSFCEACLLLSPISVPSPPSSYVRVENNEVSFRCPASELPGKCPRISSEMWIPGRKRRILEALEQDGLDSDLHPVLAELG